MIAWSGFLEITGRAKLATSAVFMNRNARTCYTKSFPSLFFGATTLTASWPLRPTVPKGAKSAIAVRSFNRSITLNITSSGLKNVAKGILTTSLSSLCWNLAIYFARFVAIRPWWVNPARWSHQVSKVGFIFDHVTRIVSDVRIVESF